MSEASERKKVRPSELATKERNDYNSKAEKILLYKGDVTGKIVCLIEYTARGFIFLAWLGKCSSGNRD